MLELVLLRVLLLLLSSLSILSLLSLFLIILFHIIIAFTRAAGIFIFYLTSCANEYAKDAKRSTIFKQDILNALRELDFDEFVPPLEAFLEQYQKDQEERKKISKKQKESNDGSVPMETNDGDNEEDGNDEEEEDDVDGNEEES